MIFSKGNILKKIFFTVLIILLLFVGVLIIQYNFDISNEVSKTLEVSDKLNNSDLVYYFLYTLQESSLFFDFEFTTVKYFISLSVILSGFIISSLRLIIIKIFLVLFNFTSDVLIKCNVSIGHISDTLLKITDSVGKALFWFITVWSLKLAFIIIYYPNYVGDIFNNVFTTLHVLTFTWLSLSLISSAKGEYLKIKKGKRVRVEKVEFIFFTIKLLFVVSVILIILLTLWKDQLYVLTTLGVASATALFFILNNDNLGGSYFATRLIVFNENVKVGDWIVVNEIEGTVNKIDIFETEIRLFDQSMLTISNSELKKHIIINKSRREVRRIKFDFKIPIENSTESVTKIIESIEKMLLKHKDISRGINYSDKIKRHLGTSDIQFVHLVGIGNSYTINIYCFINKDDWELHRFVNQDIQLKIVDILKDNDTSPVGDTLKIY